MWNGKTVYKWLFWIPLLGFVPPTRYCYQGDSFWNGKRFLCFISELNTRKRSIAVFSRGVMMLLLSYAAKIYLELATEREARGRDHHTWYSNARRRDGKRMSTSRYSPVFGSTRSAAFRTFVCIGTSFN